MEKIKEYRLRANGKRGAVLTIPAVFLKDNKIGPGDTVEVYRETSISGDYLLIKATAPVGG